MNFKDNPLKFLRKLKRMDAYCSMSWMYSYRNKIESFPDRIKQLQWALDCYYNYKTLCYKYSGLKCLYREYKNMVIGGI